MPAGNVLFACKSATHGGALAGVTHARLTASTAYKLDHGGADYPGDADCLVTDSGMGVELYGNQFAPLLGRIGQTKGSCVISFFGSAGVSKTMTITNVMFTEVISPVDIPAKDSGGKIAPFGIRGVVLFGSADTFATVATVA